MAIRRIERAILTIRIRTLPPRHEFRIDHGQGHEQEEGNEQRTVSVHPRWTVVAM